MLLSREELDQSFSILDRFLSGQSISHISREEGVSRKYIKRILITYKAAERVRIPPEPRESVSRNEELCRCCEILLVMVEHDETGLCVDCQQDIARWSALFSVDAETIATEWIEGRLHRRWDSWFAHRRIKALPESIGDRWEWQRGA